jgi:hypothetical protein
MFQPLLCRLRLRLKTSAWASGGPAGGRRARHAWGDAAHRPCAASHAAERFNDHIFAGSVRFSKFSVD